MVITNQVLETLDDVAFLKANMQMMRSYGIGMTVLPDQVIEPLADQVIKIIPVQVIEPIPDQAIEPLPDQVISIC